MAPLSRRQHRLRALKRGEAAAKTTYSPIVSAFQKRGQGPTAWSLPGAPVCRLWCWVFLALVNLEYATAQNPPGSPTVETIVERMAQARAENRVRLRRYVVTRNYMLFGKERDTARSEVTAELTFVPPNSKTYSIQERSGSGLGEKLVRQMLDGETEIVRENGSTDLSPDNYSFRLAGEESVDERPCYVVEISPRRRDKNLLRGTLWVDSGTYLLRRLEGEPAKSPSWWLRRPRVKFVYGEVEGMWLQTASEFTTHVRIFGQHTMISRDVKYQTASEQAGSARAPRASPLR